MTWLGHHSHVDRLFSSSRSGLDSDLWGQLAHLVDHAQKPSKLCGVGRCPHVGNSFDLVSVWENTVCADNVTKEVEGTLAKLALLLVQGDTGCLESLEGGKKSLLVFLLVLPMDDDVAHQVQNTGRVVKDLIHPSMEVLGGAGDTKNHLIKAKAAKWGDECGQMT